MNFRAVIHCAQIMALLSTQSLLADTLLDERFDRGLSEWQQNPRRGSIDIDYGVYASAPHAVRFTGNALIERTLSAVGYNNISLHWSLAAGLLESTERCEVEVNDGSGWETLVELRRDAADWLYRSGTITLSDNASDNAALRIRIGGASINDNRYRDVDYCYADDLVVTGDLITADPPTDPPSHPPPDPGNQSPASIPYSDSFDDSFDRWVADNGSGEVISDDDIYFYTNPNSVKFRGSASIQKSFNTIGYEDIQLTWHLLAGWLEVGDSCHVAFFDGSGWQSLAAIGHGDDDWWYRSGTVALPASAANQSDLKIRIGGGVGNRYDTAIDIDLCYADDFSISGTEIVDNPDDPDPPSVDSRSDITYSQLRSATYQPTGTVPNAAFTPTPEATSAQHNFVGTLTLFDEATRGGYQNKGAGASFAIQFPYLQHLPEFAFQFVQDGDLLIPVRRDLIVTEHGVYEETGWNYLIGAGRAWQDPGDQGWSRAAFPFALNQKGANCVHNGLMTFVYDDAQVSQVRYQITQETCPLHKFDMWGQLEASYSPGVSNAAQVKSAFQAELAARIPVKSLSALATEHPAVNVDRFGAQTPEITVKGLYVDGTHYIDKCTTRSGEYPFCSEMVQPSYSTAKSAFVGTAMTALAQAFGTQIYNANIVDYLPEATTQANGDWRHVTFEQTLDMATGKYDSGLFFADESAGPGSVMHDFFVWWHGEDKLYRALQYPDQVGPGTEFVYHTTDSYIVTQAMDNYLKSKTNGSADIWGWMVENVYEPAGITAPSLSTLRARKGSFTSPDGRNNGHVFGGYGMFWTPDTIVKMARFLSIDRGMASGVQRLHPMKLADSLMENGGFLATGDSNTQGYNNGFWNKSFSGTFPCQVNVPLMKGFGGITVAMMPNDVIYYVFSDGGSFAIADEIVQANEIKPFCP